MAWLANCPRFSSSLYESQQYISLKLGELDDEGNGRYTVGVPTARASRHRNTAATSLPALLSRTAWLYRISDPARGVDFNYLVQPNIRPCRDRIRNHG